MLTPHPTYISVIEALLQAGTAKNMMLTFPTPILDLADNDFKACLINMFKELKVALLQGSKDGMITMSHQIENINKETEIIKTNKLSILESKTLIIKNLTRVAQQ